MGLTRWFVQAWERPAGDGSCQWIITLTPEARYYKNFFGQTIRSAAFMSSRPGAVGVDVGVKSQACFAMARDLAHELSDWCVLRGIISANEAPLWDGRAYSNILSVCNDGPDEILDQVEFIDLPETWAQALRSDQDRRENARRWARGYAEWGEERRRESEKQRAADKRARELLNNWLTPEERQQAQSGSVVVDSQLGRCRVPLNGGMVDCSDGHRYCIIFEDGNLPAADEALMKVLLLKTDPETFRQKAKQWN